MHTKITFRKWSWLNGQITRIVNLHKRKNGCWTIPSQRALIEALENTKGIEVEE